MRFNRIFLVCSLLLLLFTRSVFAFGFIDDNSEKIIKDTWDSQTFSQLESGIVAVPQSVVDSYVQSAVTNYPDISSLEVLIHPDNLIEVNIDSKASGKVKLEGTITQFVQNKDISSMTVHIQKKELVGRPLTSWIFSRVSAGLLVKLFGNPLNGNEYGITTDVDGNNLIINFKPFIDQSSLKDVTIMGSSLVDAINIDSVSTQEGTLFLHTSLNGGSVAFNAVKSFL
ncbi:hypothetical protein [Pectinatus frisingensis]|uniref:hypothetical protein n=1 Tax=Pectinatus frisingensis TaxID=865 RepID=UPI0015F4D6F7|nr:hypothetical protein [Pectinatus frisingensis]